MAKFIEITIDGETTVARLHEDAAPNAVSRFWQALPIDETLRHVRWSGMASYVLVESLRDESIPLENRVSFYQPGAICLRPEHGESPSHTGRHRLGITGVTTGRRISPRSR